MLSKTFFKRLPGEDRRLITDGALTVGILAGGFGYVHYRKWIEKNFKMSEGHYRMGGVLTNITPFAQSYYHWWRMPKEEFDVYYRFRSFYVTGQLDTTKEVLIPRKKDGANGYDVLSPLYCYDGGKWSLKNQIEGKDPTVIEKAAVIINRGWIPADKKDRTTRPRDVHTNKLVKIPGVWRRGKDIHSYSAPNNPDSNEWHNIQLEDIGIYWDLPNYDEMKHYYFQSTAVGGFYSNTENPYTDAPQPYTPEETVYDHYGWWTSVEFNRRAF